MTPAPATSVTATPTTAAVAWTDPRDQIEFAVRMANGRLAPRHFASRDEAEQWARPEEGDEVVSYNYVCACDM